MKESVVRETAVSRIPKENIDYLKDDEKFIEFITNELTKQISERLIQAIEANDEIIVNKPVLKVSEQPTTKNYYVEYRKTVDWEPLVRCKDCVHRHQTTCPFLIANAYKDSSDDDFCSYGERRDDEDR